jgi:hypothetical protein
MSIPPFSNYERIINSLGYDFANVDSILEKETSFLNLDFLLSLRRVFVIMSQRSIFFHLRFAGEESTAKKFDNFAEHLVKFPLGRRNDNLLIAAKCYELTSEVYKKLALDEDWAKTQMALGCIHGYRPIQK